VPGIPLPAADAVAAIVETALRGARFATPRSCPYLLLARRPGERSQDVFVVDDLVAARLAAPSEGRKPATHMTKRPELGIGGHLAYRSLRAML
jgi:hypothetical protein